MTTKLDQLHERKRQLVAEIKRLHNRHNQLWAKNQPQIDELRPKVNQLTGEWRELTGQAQAAYDSGDGELAGKLADKRRITQNQSDELNDHVAGLARELAAALQDTRDAEQQLTEVIAEIERLTADSPLRHIKLSGFREARIVSPGIIEEELSILPVRLLEKITSITYVPEVARDRTLGRVLSKSRSPEKAKIYLYCAHSSHDEAKLEQAYRDTILYQAGLVLFHWAMNDDQRQSWTTLRSQAKYDASQSEADFAKCFVSYIQDPEKLRRYDNTRYKVIDAAYKAVARDD